MVGGRVVDRSKNRQKLNVWDWSGSGLGGLGRQVGVKNVYKLIKFMYIKLKKHVYSILYRILLYLLYI